MATHARLKKEFTEDETNHNLMSWLKYKTSWRHEHIMHVIDYQRLTDVT